MLTESSDIYKPSSSFLGYLPKWRSAGSGKRNTAETKEGESVRAMSQTSHQYYTTFARPLVRLRVSTQRRTLSATSLPSMNIGVRIELTSILSLAD